MGVEVQTELGSRLCTLGNRARVLEESLFAFAATVSYMPITEPGLRGLSQIAKELADDLKGIHKEYVRQSGEQSRLFRKPACKRNERQDKKQGRQVFLERNVRRNSIEPSRKRRHPKQ